MASLARSRVSFVERRGREIAARAVSARTGLATNAADGGRSPSAGEHLARDEQQANLRPPLRDQSRELEPVEGAG